MTQVHARLGSLCTPADLRSACARFLAENMLDGVGTRLLHSRTAARHALEIRGILDEPWRSALVPATWLHDIGYHPSLRESGFHPLDGARFLEAGGWSSQICQLVAWHTAAGTEAHLRGLLPQMQAYPRPPGPAVDAITWADLSSSPVGEPVGPEDRLAEILVRYPAGSLVHRSITAARSELLAAAARVELHLGISRCRG